MHRRHDFKQADPLQESQEAQAMARLAAGGPAAEAGFTALFEVYGRLFVTRLHHYGLPLDDAQDTAQEVWMDVSRAAPRYQADTPVRLYLLGFLKLARTRYFSARYKAPPVDSTSDDAVAASMELALQSLAPTSADASRYFDFFRCVRRAFARFEQAHPRLASLLLLRHVEELSLEEIAAEVGDTAEHAKAEVFSARNRFRPQAADCLGLWPG
jgi:DNA-directed RNA polymerase specialized sigma24 family protein